MRVGCRHSLGLRCRVPVFACVSSSCHPDQFFLFSVYSVSQGTAAFEIPVGSENSQRRVSSLLPVHG